MSKLDFWINWYNKEEERKLSLENSLNIPIGVIVVVLSALWYLFNEFDFEHSTVFEKFSLLFAGATFLTCGIAVYFIAKAYSANTYWYRALPMPTKLLEYEKELIEYYSKYKELHEKVDINGKFEDVLIQILASCIDVNSAHNDEKSHNIYQAKRYVLYSLIVLGFSSIPFLTNSLKKPDQVHEIKLMDLNLIQEELKTLNKNFEHGRQKSGRTTRVTQTDSTATSSSSPTKAGKRGR